MQAYIVHSPTFRLELYLYLDRGFVGKKILKGAHPAIELEVLSLMKKEFFLFKQTKEKT